MAVAFTALSVALGGVAYAAVELEADSVGRVHIREGAVGTQQLRNGSILKRDLHKSVPTRGRRGPRGARGRSGATNVTTRRESGGEIPAGQIGSVSVTCRGRERSTGGGGGFAGPPTTNDRLVESIPVGDGPPQRWRVTLYNGGENPRTPVAYAICAAP